MSKQSNEALALSQKKMARELGVSVPTLRKMMAEDPTLPYRRIGRRVLFSRAAVEDWLRSTEKAA